MKVLFVKIFKNNVCQKFENCSNTKIKGVGVAFWYLSITPQNNSKAVVKNLRILVCRSILRLTMTHLRLKIVISHHKAFFQSYTFIRPNIQSVWKFTQSTGRVRSLICLAHFFEFRSCIF
jgi:hypothetical protein